MTLDANQIDRNERRIRDLYRKVTALQEHMEELQKRVVTLEHQLSLSAHKRRYGQ